MKKQFLRVKQQFDQGFLRNADKTEEHKFDELQHANKKVDYLKNVLSALCKKLPDGDKEKKKKYPEYNLATALEPFNAEKYKQDNPCELLQDILSGCVQAEFQLVDKQLEYEEQVQELVTKPLQELLDKDLPNVLKLKKNLSKYIADRDAATSRHNNAARHGGQKENITKSELEDADMKVEQTRDAFAIEMFNVLKRENELSQYVLQILLTQKFRHENALRTLELLVPALQTKINDSKIRPTFGVNLQEHLRATKCGIAYPLELCICALTEIGLKEEGLFRVAGSVTRVKRMKLSLDSRCFKLPLLPEYCDAHVLASILKMYLRELPEPLLTKSNYNGWMSAIREQHNRLDAVRAVLQKLPQENLDNLTYLMQFLGKLAEHPESKMHASNIAIVMAPNLLWLDRDSGDMTNCNLANVLVEFFVLNVGKLFDRDISGLLKLTSEDVFGQRNHHHHQQQHDDPAEFQRTTVNAKLLEPQDGYGHATDTSSPKPTTKGKKTAAPPPPSTNKPHETDTSDAKSIHDNELGSLYVDRTKQITLTPSSIAYNKPSEDPGEVHGTATLNRSTRRTSDESRTKRRSLTMDEGAHQTISSSSSSSSSSQSGGAPPPDRPFDDARNADFRYVSSVSNIQTSHVKPVTPATAQSAKAPPVAAPRTLVDDREGTIQFLKQETQMTRSLNDDVEFNIRDAQLRKPPKPAVPVRPSSIQPRPLPRQDEAVQRTQCTLSYVPHGQQPSLVTIQSNNHRLSTGHDTQLQEKEKFLGHHQNQGGGGGGGAPPVHPSPRLSLENRNEAVTTESKFKPEVPTKPPAAVAHRKSNEMLNRSTEASEYVNDNQRVSSAHHHHHHHHQQHSRTRSDGNIVESMSLTTTPPSPKAVNRPSQPPPPPPVVQKKGGDGDVAKITGDDKKTIDDVKKSTDDGKKSFEEGKKSIDDSKKSIDSIKKSIDDMNQSVVEERKSVDDVKKLDGDSTDL